MGPIEVDGNTTLIYLAETGATRQKDRTGFELDRRPQHLCDSTVAPPLPFPVHALWICGRKWGGENVPATALYQGRSAGYTFLA